MLRLQSWMPWLLRLGKSSRSFKGGLIDTPGIVSYAANSRSNVLMNRLSFRRMTGKNGHYDTMYHKRCMAGVANIKIYPSIN